MDSALLVDYREKIKENELCVKYLDSAIEKKNMGVTVIQMVIGALGTIPKALVRGWEIYKSEDKPSASRLQHCYDWPDY